jgi:leader peptidase (prepilin peptidase) / N-methyltransferase
LSVDLFVTISAGVFGLLFGSFLNVCSLRWPMDESIVSPGSRCPNCGESVRWYDNVPVLSWLILRGKCRFCEEPISVQYPLVELATGLMWAGVFAVHGPTPEALRGAVFLTILFGISISDARFYIIPDEFSIGGAVVGFLMAFFPGGLTWIQSLIGAGVGFGVLWFVGVTGTWLIKKLSPGRLEEAGVDQAMGGGDVKMMMMVGAFVGAWGVGLTIFLGSVLALLVFGPIASFSKRLIPLGVFLAAAGAIAYGWGDQMIQWYLTQIVGLPG